MGKIMTRLGVFPLYLLAACVAFGVAGQVQTGRMALLVNDPERALPYFVEAANTNPNYVYQSVYFSEGIWTYVGRSQYLTKRYQEARQSLERAVAADPNDNLAHLYLGLTLARSGDAARGFKEIEAGMQGLFDWLEYINRVRPHEAYWDPLGEIRIAISKDLDNMAAKDFDREQMIADGEWLGYKMEDEIERVRQDERRQMDRQFERGRGGSGIGFGIGF